MPSKITAEQAARLSPSTVAALYNTLSKCTDFFVGMPFSIEDYGIRPGRVLDKANNELKNTKKSSSKEAKQQVKEKP